MMAQTIKGADSQDIHQCERHTLARRYSCANAASLWRDVSAPRQFLQDISAPVHRPTSRISNFSTTRLATFKVRTEVKTYILRIATP